LHLKENRTCLRVVPDIRSPNCRLPRGMDCASSVRIADYSPTGIVPAVALILIKEDFAANARNRAEMIGKNCREVSMAETTKLSVEKALEKLRGGDEPKSCGSMKKLTSLMKI
jgi:hypothetical protein